MYEVVLPPQRCILDVHALVSAETRLAENEANAGVKSVRKLIDYFDEAARGQPTVEMVRAFTEAINLAKSAWHAYVEEVSPSMTPLCVRATKHEQRVRIDHREMMFGGEPGSALAPLTVELTFFEKNENEAAPFGEPTEPVK